MLKLKFFICFTLVLNELASFSIFFYSHKIKPFPSVVIKLLIILSNFGFSNKSLLTHCLHNTSKQQVKLLETIQVLIVPLSGTYTRIRKVWNQRINSNAGLKATLTNLEITPGLETHLRDMTFFCFRLT